jgi:hypothetical protein
MLAKTGTPAKIIRYLAAHDKMKLCASVLSEQNPCGRCEPQEQPGDGEPEQQVVSVHGRAGTSQDGGHLAGRVGPL